MELAVPRKKVQETREALVAVLSRLIRVCVSNEGHDRPAFFVRMNSSTLRHGPKQ